MVISARTPDSPLLPSSKDGRESAAAKPPFIVRSCGKPIREREVLKSFCRFMEERRTHSFLLFSSEGGGGKKTPGITRSGGTQVVNDAQQRSALPLSASEQNTLAYWHLNASFISAPIVN